MAKEQFRVGSIKTMQGPFTVDAFHEQFINRVTPSETHVLVFGGHTGHIDKGLLAPLPFEKHNPMAQFARELQAYDIPNCCIPFDKQGDPDPRVLGSNVSEAEIKQTLNKLFYAVGFGCHLVLPVRPVQQHDALNIPKFDMNYRWRTQLADHGLLPNSEMSFNLWDGMANKQYIQYRDYAAFATLAKTIEYKDFIEFLEYVKLVQTQNGHNIDVAQYPHLARFIKFEKFAKFDDLVRVATAEDAPEYEKFVVFRQFMDFTKSSKIQNPKTSQEYADYIEAAKFAQFYSVYAKNKDPSQWEAYLRASDWDIKSDYTEPFMVRAKLHQTLSQGLLILNVISKGLAACKTQEAANAWLAELPNRSIIENTYFPREQTHEFIQSFIRGMQDKNAVQENHLDALQDPTVEAFREEGPLTVRLRQPLAVQTKKAIDDQTWQNAIHMVESAAVKIKAMAPVDVIRPERAVGVIEIGFAEPREWMLYHPAHKAVTIARHCTARSFGMVVEMAIAKKMKWIDVATLPEDQIAAIRAEIQRRNLSAHIEVRDANYKAIPKATPGIIPVEAPAANSPDEPENALVGMRP